MDCYGSFTYAKFRLINIRVIITKLVPFEAHKNILYI
jgi:hypothetical protein